MQNISSSQSKPLLHLWKLCRGIRSSLPLCQQLHRQEELPVLCSVFGECDADYGHILPECDNIFLNQERRRSKFHSSDYHMFGGCRHYCSSPADLLHLSHILGMHRQDHTRINQRFERVKTGKSMVSGWSPISELLRINFSDSSW